MSKYLASSLFCALVLMTTSAFADMNITVSSETYKDFTISPSFDGKGLWAIPNSCANGICTATLKEQNPQESATMHLYVRVEPNSQFGGYCNLYWKHTNGLTKFDTSQSVCTYPYAYQVVSPSCDVNPNGCKIAISPKPR